MNETILAGILAAFGALWLYFKVTNDGRFADLRENHKSITDSLNKQLDQARVDHNDEMKRIRQDHREQVDQLRSEFASDLNTMRAERDEARAENREFAKIVATNSETLQSVGELSGETVAALARIANYLEVAPRSSARIHGEEERQALPSSHGSQPR